MPVAGPPGHLVRRFFSVSTARPLDAAEQLWVAELLAPPEVGVFWSQPPADQRHAHDCARHVAARSGRRELVRTALLHDVGKRHARLGPVGRALATVVAALGLPGTERFDLYTRHGPVGAADLRACGAEAVVVDYAAAHHGARPASIPPDDWDLLEEADRVT